MGYPSDFKITVSDTQAYRQFGNSIVVPVVERIAKQVVESLKRPLDHREELVLQMQERRKVLQLPLSKPVKYKLQRKKK
jgi:DNA (cytosine-5)-methyltransferase 1